MFAMDAWAEFAGAALFLGLAIFVAMIMGVVLSIAGGLSLIKRHRRSYESDEERTMALKEAKTVLVVGLCLALPVPVIALLAQIEKVLFP